MSAILRPTNSAESNLFVVRANYTFSSNTGGSSSTITPTEPSVNSLPTNYSLVFNNGEVTVTYGTVSSNSNSSIYTVPPTAMANVSGSSTLSTQVVANTVSSVRFKIIKDGVALTEIPSGTTINIYIVGPTRLGYSSTNSNKGWNVAAGIVPDQIFTYMKAGFNNPSPSSIIHVGGDTTNRADFIQLGPTAENMFVYRESENVMGLGPNVKVENNLMVGNDLSVGGTVTINDVLFDSTGAGSFTVGDSSEFTMGLTVSSGALVVSGTTSVYDQLSLHSSLVVSKDASLLESLTVGSALTVVRDTNLESDLVVSGTSTLTGLATLNSGLNVVGASDFAGNMTISGTTSASGTVTLGSSLTVLGTTQLQDTLSITGNAYLASGLSVAGDTVVSGSVTNLADHSVSGTSTVAGATTLMSSLTVSGELSLGENAVLAKDLTVLSNSAVSGTVVIGSDLSVGQATTMMGEVSVYSTLNVTGSLALLNSTTLVVGGATNLSSLAVSATSVMDGAVAMKNDLSIASTLFVGSSTVLSGVTTLYSTLNVNSDQVVSGTVTIGGSAYLASFLSVAENATMEKNLTASSLNVTSCLAVTASSMEVFQGLSLGSSLVVSGNTILNNDLSVTGRVALVSSQTSVSSDLPTDPDLYVKGKSHFEGTVHIERLFIRGEATSSTDTSGIELNMAGDIEAKTVKASETVRATTTLLGNDLSVNSSVFANDVIVSSTVMTSGLTVTSATVSSSLEVLDLLKSSRLVTNNLATLESLQVQNNINTESFTSNQLSTLSGLLVNNNAFISSSLSVGGTITSSKEITTASNLNAVNVNATNNVIAINKVAAPLLEASTTISTPAITTAVNASLTGLILASDMDANGMKINNLPYPTNASEPATRSSLELLAYSGLATEIDAQNNVRISLDLDENSGLQIDSNDKLTLDSGNGNGAIVKTDGTQTLSNKTLTSPQINTANINDTAFVSSSSGTKVLVMTGESISGNDNTTISVPPNKGIRFQSGSESVEITGNSSGGVNVGSGLRIDSDKIYTTQTLSSTNIEAGTVTMNSVYVNDIVFNGASAFVVPKAMNVARETTLNGTVTVVSGINVTGSQTVDSVVASSLTVNDVATLPNIKSTSLISATNTQSTNATVDNLFVANSTVTSGTALVMSGTTTSANLLTVGSSLMMTDSAIASLKNSTVQGTLSISGDVNTDSRIIAGGATFNGAVSAVDTSIDAKSVTMVSLTSTDMASLVDVEVSGTTTLTGPTNASTLAVSGLTELTNASVTGVLTVGNNFIDGGAVVASNVYVADQTVLNSLSALNSTLESVSINQNLNVMASSTVVQDLSAKNVVASTLSVASDINTTNLNGTLVTTDSLVAALVSGTSLVAPRATIVSATATSLSGLTTNAGALNVAGNSVLNSVSVTGDVRLQSTTTVSSLVVEAESTFVSDATFNVNAVVQNRMIANQVEVTGNTIMTGTLSAGGDVLVPSMLSVSNAVMDSVTIKDTTVASALTVPSGTMLNVAGNANFTNAPTLIGMTANAATVSQLTVPNHAIVENLSATKVTANSSINLMDVGEIKKSGSKVRIEADDELDIRAPITNFSKSGSKIITEEISSSKIVVNGETSLQNTDMIGSLKIKDFTSGGFTQISHSGQITTFNGQGGESQVRFSNSKLYIDTLAEPTEPDMPVRKQDLDRSTQGLILFDQTDSILTDATLASSVFKWGAESADETSASAPTTSLGSSTKILKLSYDVAGKTISSAQAVNGNAFIAFGGVDVGFGLNSNDSLLVSITDSPFNGIYKFSSATLETATNKVNVSFTRISGLDVSSEFTAGITSLVASTTTYVAGGLNHTVGTGNDGASLDVTYDGVTTSIVVDAGTYEAVDLAAHLTTKLNTAFPAATSANIEYNVNLERYIVNTGPNDITVTNSSLIRVIGLAPGETVTATSTVPKTTGSIFNLGRDFINFKVMSVAANVEAGSGLYVDISGGGQKFAANVDSNYGTKIVSNTFAVDTSTMEFDFGQAVKVQSTLSVTGSIATDDSVLVANNVTIGGDLTVSGASNITGALTFNDSLALSNNLSVGGETAMQAITASTLSLTGGLDAAGNATVAGTLTVDQVIVNGATSIGGTSGSNNFTVSSSAVFADDVTFSGTASAKQAVDMESTLSVSGAAYAHGGLDVVGMTTVQAVTASNDLTVNGATNLSGTTISGTLSAGQSVITGLTVPSGSTTTMSGDIQIQEGVTVVGGVVTDSLSTAGSTVSGNASVGGDMSVVGTASASTLSGTSVIAQNLDAKTDLKSSGTTTLVGGATLASTLSVAEDVTMSKNLSLAGGASMSSVSTSGPANLNSLNVAAESVFSGGMSTSDISVTGNVSSSGSVISNGLSVSGSSNLENMTASGSVTVSGTSTMNTVVASGITSTGNLQVSSDTYVNSLTASGNSNLMGVAADTISVANNQSVGGALWVGGETTLQNISSAILSGTLTTLSGSTVATNGLVSLKGETIVDSSGSLTVNSNASFNNNISTNNVYTGGNLSVGGTTTLSGNTVVDGTTTLMGDVTVTSGTTTVSGLTTIGNFAGQGTMSVAGAITGNSSAHFNSLVTPNINVSDTIMANAIVASSMNLDLPTVYTNKLTVNEDFEVTGATMLGGTLSVDGNVEANQINSNYLSVSTAINTTTALVNNLSVNGISTLLGGISVAGDVQFSADTKIGANISIAGTTKTNNLSVNGQIICGELSVANFTIAAQTFSDIGTGDITVASNLISQDVTRVDADRSSSTFNLGSSGAKKLGESLLILGGDQNQLSGDGSTSTYGSVPIIAVNARQMNPDNSGKFTNNVNGYTNTSGIESDGRFTLQSQINGVNVATDLPWQQFLGINDGMLTAATHELYVSSSIQTHNTATASIAGITMGNSALSANSLSVSGSIVTDTVKLGSAPQSSEDAVRLTDLQSYPGSIKINDPVTYAARPNDSINGSNYVYNSVNGSLELDTTSIEAQTVDSSTLAAGNSVAVMNRAVSSQNGIYEVSTASHADGSGAYELTLESGGNVFNGKVFAGSAMASDDINSESYTFDSSTGTLTWVGDATTEIWDETSSSVVVQNNLPQTVNGTNLAINLIVSVTNRSNTSENGLYEVTTADATANNNNGAYVLNRVYSDNYTSGNNPVIALSSDEVNSTVFSYDSANSKLVFQTSSGAPSTQIANGQFLSQDLVVVVGNRSENNGVYKVTSSNNGTTNIVLTRRPTESSTNSNWPVAQTQFKDNTDNVIGTADTQNVYLIESGDINKGSVFGVKTNSTASSINFSAYRQGVGSPLLSSKSMLEYDGDSKLNLKSQSIDVDEFTSNNYYANLTNNNMGKYALRTNKNGELALQFTSGSNGYIVDGKYVTPPSAYVTNAPGDSIRLNTTNNDFTWSNGVLSIRKNNYYTDGRITSGNNNRTGLWLNLNDTSSYAYQESNQWFSMKQSKYFALTLNTTDNSKKYINLDDSESDSNALTLRLDSNLFSENNSTQNELQLVGGKTDSGRLFIGDANNTVSGTQQAVVLDYNSEAFSMTQADNFSTYKLQLNNSDQFEYVASQLTIKDGLSLANMSGTSILSDNLTVFSQLNVSGTTTMTGEVNITNGKYIHSDDINTPNLMVSGGGTGLTCPGNAKFEGTTSVLGPISISSATQINSDVLTAPSLAVGTGGTGLVVAGDTNLIGSTSITNALLLNTVTLSATNMSSTGNSSFDKMLTTSGLTVSNSANISTLNVSGDTTMSGVLNAGSVSVTSLNSTGTIDAGGQTVYADVVSVSSMMAAVNLDTAPSGNALFNGSLVASGTTTLAGDVVVTGSSTISGNASLANPTVTGTLAVTGTQNNTGVTNITNLSATDVVVVSDGSMTVEGTTNLTGAVTVTGSSTISGDVTMSGAVNLVGLSATGTVATSGTLSANSITVDSGATITGTTVTADNVTGTTKVTTPMVELGDNCRLSDSSGDVSIGTAGIDHIRLIKKNNNSGAIIYGNPTSSRLSSIKSDTFCDHIESAARRDNMLTITSIANGVGYVKVGRINYTLDPSELNIYNMVHVLVGSGASENSLTLTLPYYENQMHSHSVRVHAIIKPGATLTIRVNDDYDVTRMIMGSVDSIAITATTEEVHFNADFILVPPSDSTHGYWSATNFHKISASTI